MTDEHRATRPIVHPEDAVARDPGRGNTADIAPSEAAVSDQEPGAGGRPVRPPNRRRGVLHDGTLDPRDNGLNLIRLVLAWSVLVSHAFPISGVGDGPGWKGENLGGWAVIGFFVVSGYLITGSRRSNGAGHYLINRVARIYPGFLVSLFVVAFVFAPWEYAHQHGTLDKFLTTNETPFNFVFDNIMLDITNYGVAGGPTVTPYKGAWNGSLWTLWFEFMCYIVVGVLMTIPWARRNPLPTIALFAVSVAAWANKEALAPYWSGYHQNFLMKLLPYFMGGAIIAMLKRRLPLHWWAGVGSLVIAFAVVNFWPTWGGQLVSPLFAYGLLWLASVLPCPALIKEHDISYGVYVYAWPCTVAAYMLGLLHSGMVPYIAGATLGTVVLATLSWLGVERPSMRLARGKPAFGA